MSNRLEMDLGVVHLLISSQYSDKKQGLFQTISSAPEHQSEVRWWRFDVLDASQENNFTYSYVSI